MNTEDAKDVVETLEKAGITTTTAEVVNEPIAEKKPFIPQDPDKINDMMCWGYKRRLAYQIHVHNGLTPDQAYEEVKTFTKRRLEEEKKNEGVV